ncbi:MAG: glycosyltransferase family 2 protein [Bacteroidales bacterium]
MNNYPRITIITPSFNQGKYIEKTIRSIVDQNYPNLEYFIIDGGSTDNTIDIIKKYESQIKYWVSEPDNGQAHAINKGLAKATGDVFNWINSDDYMEPGSLFHIAEAFVKKPGIKVVCGYTHCFYDETGKTSHTYRMGIKRSVAQTVLNVEMNQPGTFYDLRTIQELGGINESLRYVFDSELWFRYLCKFGMNDICLSNLLICHFRLHAQSKTVHEGFELFWHEHKDIWYSIAQQIDTPPYLLNYIHNDLVNKTYSTVPWNINALETIKYNSHFAHLYMYLLYKDFKYAEARELFLLTLKANDIRLEVKYFLLAVKIFLLPRRLLTQLRNRNG